MNAFKIILGTVAMMSSVLQAQDDLLRKARLEFRLGDYDAALAAVDDASRASGRDPMFELFRLSILVKADRQADAIAAIDSYLKRHRGLDAKELLSLRTSLDALGSTPSGPEVVKASLERLLEAVRAWRIRGEPARMIPLLLQAERLAPNDWRVLLGLGEAFGVGSMLRDPFVSQRYLDKFLDAVPTAVTRTSDTEADQFRSLARFLGEARTGEVWLADLRTAVMGYLINLEDRKPIQLWGRPQRQLDNEIENVIVARNHGEQRELLRLAKALCAKNPDDPLAQYLVGEVAGSGGPAFDRKLAIRSFRRFLELSGTDILPPERQDPKLPPVVGRSDLASLIHAVREGEASDELQGIRLEVHNCIAYLEEDNRNKLLLAPDIDWLDKKTKSAERRLSTEQARLQDAEERQSDAEGRLRYWRAALERERRKRPLPDLERVRDNIRRAKSTLERAGKDIDNFSDRVAELESALQRLQKRFDAFDH